MTIEPGRFRYGVVASPLHDPASVEALTEPLRVLLAGAGGRPIAAHDGGEADGPELILVATGGTETAILDRAGHIAGPVVLVAHPLHNSLPASLEAMARLHADGRRGAIVQVDPTRPRGMARLDEVIDDLAAAAALRGARLGLVGPPSDWLVASVPDRGALAERWGVEVVDLAGPRPGPGDARAADEVVVRLGSAQDHDRGPDELHKAALLLPGLERVARDGGVDAVSVRCFDFLGPLATSGCVALAEMNDDGLVAGCEGDVAATVAMLWVRSLLGTASWMANPATIDRDAGTVLLAHCTVAPSLVEDLELHTHFESGLGVGLRGRFPAGGYTVIRLGGRALERSWIAEGELVATGDSPDLCRTQMTLALDDPADAGRLLDDPLGNHLVVVPGRHRVRMQRWLELALGSAAPALVSSR